MRNFRKVLEEVDVEPLLAQVREHPELWDIDDEWTRDKPTSAIYNVSNIVLRFNRGEMWDRPAFDLLDAARPVVNDLIEVAGGQMLGRVIISRLKPGQHIVPHWDRLRSGLPPMWEQFQIPLSVHPNCIFGCKDDQGDERLWMEPGDAYWFDNQAIHWVYNDAPVERISMLVGIQPAPEFREWVNRVR